MKEIIIKDIKSIKQLNFNIPNPGLYIITGTNGAGKTTLFTCINRICNNNAYRAGFPAKSNENFDDFSGSITYKNNGQEVSYSRKPSGEWRPNTKNSTVLASFNYPSILNITTNGKRIFSQDDIKPRSKSTDSWINDSLNEIFDTKKFSKMAKIKTKGRGKVKDRRSNAAFMIPLGEEKYYSERSFSFGEIVLLNMLFDIEKEPNGAMILIDELEMAIHPSSQIRLINFLKKLASTRDLTILVSTHSASIIKSQTDVIFLNKNTDDTVEVIYNCPPAKAIGAIGMREDTNPDIVILVEDPMAKSLFFALQQKYMELHKETNYLDIRILDIGSYKGVLKFYKESINYVFYNNVYVAAFFDKDVETDIIPYPQYVDTEVMNIYNTHKKYLHFLPYTPEVLLVKTFSQQKNDLIKHFKTTYNNQQFDYQIEKEFDFEEYNQPFPIFSSQEEYNLALEKKRIFRNKCKTEAKRIVLEICGQLNLSKEEVYRIVYKYSVEQMLVKEINIHELLGSIMNRKR